MKFTANRVSHLFRFVDLCDQVERSLSLSLSLFLFPSYVQAPVHLSLSVHCSFSLFPAPVIQKGVNDNRFYEILINCYCAFTTA